MDRLFSKELPSRKAHKIVMEEIERDQATFRQNVEGSGLGLDKGEKPSHLEEV